MNIISILVRNEDELDLDMIIDKVSKVSASAYNFKEKPQGRFGRVVLKVMMNDYL